VHLVEKLLILSEKFCFKLIRDKGYPDPDPKWFIPDPDPQHCWKHVLKHKECGPTFCEWGPGILHPAHGELQLSLHHPQLGRLGERLQFISVISRDITITSFTLSTSPACSLIH
jgi:hypothetical protein